SHRHPDRAAQRVLSRGGLPPGFPGPPSHAPLHRGQRPPEDRGAQARLPRALQREGGHADRPLTCVRSGRPPPSREPSPRMEGARTEYAIAAPPHVGHRVGTHCPTRPDVLRLLRSATPIEKPLQNAVPSANV